jgi:hypothetical protein
MFLYVRKENPNSCARGVGCHGAKFSRPSALAPGIFASPRMKGEFCVYVIESIFQILTGK